MFRLRNLWFYPRTQEFTFSTQVDAFVKAFSSLAEFLLKLKYLKVKCVKLPFIFEYYVYFYDQTSFFEEWN